MRRRARRTGLRARVVAWSVALTLATTTGCERAERGERIDTGHDTGHDTKVAAIEDLFVERLGEGSPLWVIPEGPGVAHDYFHPSLELLADHHELIFHDPRGTGDSPAAPAYGIEEDLADLEAARRRLGIERVQILGHGSGAFLALLYAERHARHVSTLVLVTPIMGRDDFDAALLALRARLDPTGVDALTRLTRATSPEGAAAWLEPPLRVLLADPRSPILPALLDATRVHPEVNRRALPGWYSASRRGRALIPILIVAGKHDVIPLERLRSLRDRLHGARLEIFEDSGHFPFAEEPELFASTVVAFLSEFDERRLGITPHAAP